MIDLNNKASMELFLERYEIGDPLKDWYDEQHIQDTLAEAVEILLEIDRLNQLPDAA